MPSPATEPQARLKPAVKMDRASKPLKTYGKRSATTESEAPSKKRRTIERDDDSEGSVAVTSPFDLPQPPSPELPPSLPPQSARKGTITSYFKVVPSSATNSDSSSSSCADRAPTPPTSPPTHFARRKTRRRLTTRHVSYDSETQAEEDDSHQADKSPSRETLTRDRAKALRSSTNDSLNKQLKSTKIAPKRSNDEQTNTSLANKTKIITNATVQTTLSLSMTDSGFTECRTCGMLYNPLHAKDVALHARTHAAAIRQQKRPLRDK